MYLKLISAVTEDILSRGHFSDRFVSSPLSYDSYTLKRLICLFFFTFSRILNLVIQRHIDMNRHHLDEVSLLLPSCFVQSWSSVMTRSQLF